MTGLTEWKDNIDGYEYYENRIHIDGQPYGVYIRVRNTPMGDKYYGHTISQVVDEIKIEPLARDYDKESLHPVNAAGSSNNNVPHSETVVNNNSTQNSGKDASTDENKSEKIKHNRTVPLCCVLC